MSQHFPSIILITILTSQYVKAEFCAGDVAAGECFANKLVPMAVGATVGGIAFSIVGSILSIVLFCKTRKRMKANRDKVWIAQKETSNWRRDCQDSGFENIRSNFLGDNRPQYGAHDQSVYSERETAIPLPSNCSEVLDAIDTLEAEDPDVNHHRHSPSGPYWVPEQSPSYHSGKSELYLGQENAAADDDDEEMRRNIPQNVFRHRKTDKMAYRDEYSSSDDDY